MTKILLVVLDSERLNPVLDFLDSLQNTQLHIVHSSDATEELVKFCELSKEDWSVEHKVVVQCRPHSAYVKLSSTLAKALDYLIHQELYPVFASVSGIDHINVEFRELVRIEKGGGGHSTITLTKPIENRTMFSTESQPTVKRVSKLSGIKPKPKRLSPAVAWIYLNK